MSGLPHIIVDVVDGWTLHHPKSKKGLRQGSALPSDTDGRLIKHPARPYRSSESYDDGLLTPMFARPTTESRLLETLARDLAALLAGNRKHEVLCVAEHSPVWSGAACGDGRGLVTRWSANDRVDPCSSRL